MAKLLLVEDNPANMKLAAFLLESAGHAVTGVGTAEAGIEAAQLDPPDVILMDIQLPGMDGLEAARVLRSDPSTQSIPIIAVTALVMPGDEERILQAGFSGYVSKPIEYQDFLKVVANQLATP